jgi:WXG100 family type VII secretion target
MTSYQVDSEAIAAATVSIRGTMDRIQGESASLLNQLVGLQGSWTGQAALGFQAIVADWRATQARVDESLGAVAAAVGRAGQGYADVELANAQLFRR